ncbi:RagB/SusD family nutrient uptake outer membrane protein [Cyclobacterium sp. 1_MG-2023]|uniref:RagB/SusD family nutrient uptake outer membrane protein n=1 Tax=Cyclobacterium sp. 1_MG-2023 TaxID=3062681 RepID=UPI0026E46F43|nr:RagB/SusD family nutrient uptake outer membrane protein [Cyclobacterium sp. 1_MG-2023]MDO6439226.1 RagB/SusD family nutrient uptake outer membrane protein [Cyclobacterium sp. 1_MG-2023]
MKKITIYISVLFLVVTTACNDEYLERYPLDQISDAQFWTSSTDIELYANQFYIDLRDPQVNWRKDDKSDNNAPGDRNTYVWGEYVIPATGGGWGKSDWQPIRRCNYALARIAEMEKDALVLRYEGEIRFFKSFYYQKMIERFGDVPWYEEDLQTDSEGLVKPRDSRKVVFENMLNDLDFAIENLPEESGENRLTKYVALTFKAEACLFEGTFRKYHGLGDHEAILAESAAAAEAVINSGLFSLYSTGNPNQDYFDLFVQYNLTGNPEAIFFQRFIEGIRMHNNVRSLGEPHTGYTKDFVQSYLSKDGLPIALSSLYQGDQNFEDEFVDRDPRMKQSIYVPDRPYRIYSDGSIDYRTMPEFDNNYVTTSYYITKGYSPYEVDRLQNQSTIDVFTYRYGKLLVTYAEAKAELGEATQEVLDNSINLLRDRVGMPHLEVNVGFEDPNWPDWEVPVTPLINEIRRERRIETAGEGTRWEDLVRWKAGKLLENPLTYVGAVDPETGEYRVIYPGNTRTWDDKLYLYPIPVQELSLNPQLTQNPGWE